MRLGKMVVIAMACTAVSLPAEARPRLLGLMRALAAPVGIIAGATAARARAHRSHAAQRRDAPESRAVRPVAVAGWSGPLFWPYAYDDILDYAFGQRGGADRFWSHGYGDVLDGMFVPASIYDGRAPRVAMKVADNGGGNPANGPRSWLGMCGSQATSPVDGLMERIRNLVEPTSEQTSALNALEDALAKAYARVQAACPNAAATEAPERLDLMSTRLRAMRQAAVLVLTPLRNFYATLTDEQKARLNGSVFDDQTNTVGASAAATSATPTSCSAGEDAANWPTSRLVQRVRPTRDQIADLETLRLTSASLGKFVASTCADKVQTPPERLDAVQKRLGVLRYAVMHVSPAVDQFYGSLSSAQKARFSALGR